MKKQELLEEIVKLDIEVSENFPHYDLVDKEAVLALINQLEEPEKVVIPQFVADYIESQDDPIYEMCINYEMWGVNGDDGTTSFTGEIAEWFDDNLNVENYYRACIDGYEVEKEKKYRVTFNLTEWNDEASELEEYSVFLALDVTSDETLFTASRDGIRDYRTDLTESEIKAIDERYWSFAEELEG